MIRRGLAVRNDPARRPDLPPLPPELDARIVAYRTEKLALQKALLAKVEEVGRDPPASTRMTDKHGRVTDKSAALQQEKIRDAIAAYTRDNAVRYAALEKNKEAIRT